MKLVRTEGTTGGGFWGEYRQSNQRDVFRERLETFAVCLHHGDSEMPGLASLDIANGARLALMRTANNAALGAIFQLVFGTGVHGPHHTLGRFYKASR